jgi:nucleoid-associated protein YgaU
VAKGDNLSRIAQHFYGRQDWKRIFDANRDQLSDPDRIQPGQVLKIPAPEGDA